MEGGGFRPQTTAGAEELACTIVPKRHFWRQRDNFIADFAVTVRYSLNLHLPRFGPNGDVKEEKEKNKFSFALSW